MHDRRKEGHGMRHHLPQVRQMAARHVQSWARHATSFAAGAANGSTSRAKLGTTRDIICRRCGKRYHVMCKVGGTTPPLIYIYIRMDRTSVRAPKFLSASPHFSGCIRPLPTRYAFSHD